MRSTGVHLADGRCTLVVVDHDGDEPRVVDHRSVALAAGVVVAGRVEDPEALAQALSEIVGAARGQVVVAWWPPEAMLTTVDCTDVAAGSVGEAVDRVIVQRFGKNRPSVVLRKVTASGRALTTVGACQSSDVENARRSLLSCGLDQASLIFSPAALAIFTRNLDAPTVLVAGGDQVALLYGFAGWPFIGGALDNDGHEPVVEMCGVGALSASQYGALRPPMTHLGASRVFESEATLESIARELLTPSANGHLYGGDAADSGLLDSVTGQYLVALGAAMWGAAAVADLVPAGLSVLPGMPEAPAADVAPAAAPAAVEEAVSPRRRVRVLVLAAIAVCVLGAIAMWFATSVDESTEWAVPTTASSTATTGVEAAATSPVDNATSASTTSRSSAPATTPIDAPSTLPFVAHAHGGVYRQGKLYLEGTLPTRAAADAFVAKAAAVIGAANVVDNYVIDARAPAPSSGFVRVDEPFLFPTGSEALDAQYLGVLDLGVIVMKQNVRARMIVTGHTDSVGDEDANQLLSVRRANAVIDYMVSMGVARSRFDAGGKGETSPIADNATEAGRQLNRRIEVELLGLLDTN
ncbi:MAG: OmpA family protein [Acidimicrobiales bacterium]